ncbi:Ras-related protein Rab5 [Camellia lanceoleosa]|uniref:Ras-related protein Rab5 n=1 Tax=Camellia lanceoleosa TaxID=1840588 RepID=A0ACC0IVP6_9ERIC|nr:Ras-related protein Rab5 [Camellia lanceoleosa]
MAMMARMAAAACESDLDGQIWCSATVVTSHHRCSKSPFCICACLLGDMLGAGKSSLVLRFVKGQFLEFRKVATGGMMGIGGTKEIKVTG